jgi:hypothetical protein
LQIFAHKAQNLSNPSRRHAPLISTATRRN